MKFLTLYFALLATLAQYWEESAVATSLQKHVEELCLVQNEGRSPGSEGEKYAADYIRQALLSKGVDVFSGEDGDFFGIKTPKNDTLVSRNVTAIIEGYDKVLRSKYIVVGARMDNMGTNTLTIDGKPVTQVYTGANGNASGVAMLIELAGRLASSSVMLKRSVIITAFGSSTYSLSGSWHFLHQSFAADSTKISAMVNLDMLGIDRDGMYAFTSGNEDLNMLIGKINSSPMPVHPNITGIEPYSSDHQMFYASHIPSVMFTSGRYPEHNTPRDVPSLLNYDFMERELEYLYEFIIELANCPDGVPSFRYVPDAKNVESQVHSWSDCEVPPTFFHNPDPSHFLQKWVYPYLKYPEECVQEGVQGRVMVEFIIGKDGKVRNVRAVKSPDERLSEAAVKVVAASPDWKAGKLMGKKVDCSMTIPVEFRLQRKKGR